MVAPVQCASCRGAWPRQLWSRLTDSVQVLLAPAPATLLWLLDFFNIEELGRVVVPFLVFFFCTRYCLFSAPGICPCLVVPEVLRLVRLQIYAFAGHLGSLLHEVHLFFVF